MIYAHAQSEQAITQLQDALREAKDAKWYRRLKIVQLSMAGHNVTQLASEFDLSPATVREYIKAYNRGQIEALRPKKSPGRPKKVGQLTRDNWEKILHRTPNQYEKLQTDSRQWTLELLVNYAMEYLGQKVVFQTISQALRRCSYRTGRSKLRIGSPDPDYTVKRQRVESLRSKPVRGN